MTFSQGVCSMLDTIVVYVKVYGVLLQPIPFKLTGSASSPQGRHNQVPELKRLNDEAHPTWPGSAIQILIKKKFPTSSIVHYGSFSVRFGVLCIK